MLSGSSTYVFGFRPRSGHLHVTSCMRWLLEASLPITIGLPAHAGRRCIPLSLRSLPPLILWACTTLELVGDLLDPRVACDFVSRLGGWDTIFFLFRERLVETFLGGPRFVVAEALKLRDMDTHSNRRGAC